MSPQYGAMLREGLAAEFPSAKRAFDRLVASIRSPQVSREAPLWAAISAFGAAWAVGAIGQVLASGLRVAGLRDPASWLSGGFAILAYAIAIPVALRAGGRRGLIWYLAILAARIGLQTATALPGFLTFCERSGDNCSAMQLVVPYVYLAAGLAVGAAAIFVVRAGPERPNAFLTGAGAFALFTSVTSLAFYVVQPKDVVAASAMAFTLGGGAAFAAGVLVRLRSAHVTPAAWVAGALALSSLASSGPFLVFLVRDGAGLQPAALSLAGLTEPLAVLLGWLAADRVQRARTTAAA